MKNKSFQLPAIIVVIGMVFAVVACLITGITKTPTITEQEFHYTITYKLDGETKTLAGVYKCRFDGHSYGENPRDRYYTGEYTVDGETTLAHSYTIAERDGYELYIVTVFNDCYLMGDREDVDYEPFLEEPYLEAIDKEGSQYDDVEMLEVFDAELIHWEYPEPIENTFVFSGFSVLHTESMLAMLLIGLLVILTCLCLVKRDNTISYKLLDKLSVLVNFAAVFAAIPVITLCVWLLQITMSTDEFLYQMYLCIPAFTAFTVAVSIVLRRKGFTKAGFFVQFAGPVLFAVPVFLESIFYNIFM